MISGLDFIGVPSTNPERSRTFYVETLGLRPDRNARFEFWAGDTCFGIWEPEKPGLEFSPQNLAHLALHVDDVDATKSDLEAKGSSLRVKPSTPGSATWRCSPTPTAMTSCFTVATPR